MGVVETWEGRGVGWEPRRRLRVMRKWSREVDSDVLRERQPLTSSQNWISSVIKEGDGVYLF